MSDDNDTSRSSKILFEKLLKEHMGELSDEEKVEFLNRLHRLRKSKDISPRQLDTYLPALGGTTIGALVGASIVPGAALIALAGGVLGLVTSLFAAAKVHASRTDRNSDSLEEKQEVDLEPYDLGYQTFLQQKPQSTNPYNSLDRERFVDWNRGWKDAKEKTENRLEVETSD